MHQITVEFDELPTSIINGADVAFTAGEVVISFDREGWDVDEIRVEAFGKSGRRMEVLDIREHQQAYCCLLDCIKDRCSRRIESDIDEFYEVMRDEAAEMRREMLRDDRMMGV